MIETREPLMQQDDPLIQSGSEQTTLSDDFSEDCKHDAIEDTSETVVGHNVAINVRLDKESCRKIRILAAIRDTTQSAIVDAALRKFFTKTSLPFPYLPPEILIAPKVRRTMYVAEDTYARLCDRAKLEVHSLDSVIYRAILDELSKLPEGLQ